MPDLSAPLAPEGIAVPGGGEVRLLLGDQLDRRHPWFDAVDPEVTDLMAETAGELGYVRHHRQKAVAFLGAMRSFARALRDAGHRVLYHALDHAVRPLLALLDAEGEAPSAVKATE